MAQLWAVDDMQNEFDTHSRVQTRLTVGTAQEHSCIDRILYKGFWNFDHLWPDVLYIDTYTKVLEERLRICCQQFTRYANSTTRVQVPIMAQLMSQSAEYLANPFLERMCSCPNSATVTVRTQASALWLQIQWGASLKVVVSETNENSPVGLENGLESDILLPHRRLKCCRLCLSSHGQQTTQILWINE